MTRLSVRIKNPTSSVERLQLRLNEADINKRVNEHMEESDKMPWTTRTRLRITNGSSASSTSSSRSGSQTSSSTSSSNISPRTTQPRRKRSEDDTPEPRTGNAVATRRGSVGQNRVASKHETPRNRAPNAKPEHSEGQYYIRRYRRESRSATGEVQVMQTRDYVYWPPERRRSLTSRPAVAQ